jgi:hypothetical protein
MGTKQAELKQPGLFVSSIEGGLSWHFFKIHRTDYMFIPNSTTLSFIETSI